MASALDILIRINQKMGGDDAIGKLKNLDKQIRVEEKSLADLQKQMAKAMSGNVDDLLSPKKFLALSKSIDDGKARLGELKGSFNELGGAESILASKDSALAQVKNAGPWFALVAAIAAVGVAIVALTAKFASFALEAANAHRSMLLTISALSGGKAAGEANAKAIERVASSTALAKGQIEDIAKRLAIAGLSGKRFEDTLRTVAQATALMGEQAGAHIEGILEKSKALGHFEINPRSLKGLGLSFADLAKQLGMTEVQLKVAMKAGKISVEDGMDAINKAMGKRFGGSSAAMMLDFGVQIMKLKENLTSLFKDVAIEPFLKALKDLLSLFDENTVSGKALRFMAKAIFDELFSVAAKVLPYVKLFLIGMLIMLVQVYIWWKQLKKAVEEAFGGSGMSKVDAMSAALMAGKVVVVVFLVAILLLAAAVAVLTVNLIILTVIALLPFIAIAAVIYLAVSAVESFGQALAQLGLPDLTSAAGDMMSGLVTGILGKIGDVVAAMTNVGAAAKQSLMSVLGIASPSRVMMKLGAHTGEGFAQGVEDSEERAQGAMTSMAKPSEKGRGKRGGGDTFYITIHATVEKAAEIKDALADFFEGKGIEVGVGPEPA